MRHSLPRVAALATCLAAAFPALRAAESPVYRLELQIDPAAQSLEAEVRLALPAERAGKPLEFLLAKPLEILESDPRVESVASGDIADGFSGINGSSLPLAARKAVARYRVQLPAGATELRLKYRGRIDFPLDSQAEEYTRGFRETPGLISTDGVYLAGSTLWYPLIGTELVSFELTSNVPEGWHLISQGSGNSRDERGRASWKSDTVVDEIYLVGGPLTRYTQPAGAAEAEVFLRTPEEPLARKYLAATAQYIEMYRKLIGPYPYGKFALVENFWETGYGMPSFTLLGPQIIRFPFILTSSYPHEILHNWWGNSVFVDYASGNWCEGLTAYMADHLLKEQVGQGAEFRRDTLKKYRDFVKEGRDFPLTEFRSRHSAATEAVGYGKTAMGFHMLRLQLGDEAFRKALAQFYRSNRGKRASFDDVRAALESVSKQDLGVFFEQWVKRTGAPQLGLEQVRTRRHGAGFRVEGAIVQRQAGPTYTLEVPLQIATGGETRVERVSTSGKRTPFAVDLTSAATLVELDPEFDVFRLLDPRETAPSIGQIFGEHAVLAVLPAGETPERQAAYRALVERWRSPSHAVEFVTDAELRELPAGKPAWLLGADNRLARRLFSPAEVPGFGANGRTLTLDGQSVSLEGHSAVVIRRHPGSVSHALGWLVVAPGAEDAIVRKLPHYGKYSYLAFRGVEAENTLKGEWATSDSPLRVVLQDAPGAGGQAGARAAAASASPSRPKRAPLIELLAAFSADALRKHVEWLADPAREGRGVGTAGLDAAAEYIAEQFRSAGLAPGAAAQDVKAEGLAGYFQSFRLPAGPEGRPVEVRNVIAWLPAKGAPASGDAAGAQAVLVTAHYDHLGRGWPAARAGESGRIHPGADDNASGVAVLLELARAYGAAGGAARPLVFVAFSAEESGLRGSRYFLEHPAPVQREQIRAVVNLDTVGRLGTQEINALATSSASEWPHIFRGIGFTTGIRVKSVEGAAESSDQLAFIERGIPGVQIFTGAHLDYHRPSDTAEKIDAAGMVKVATVVREAVDYLLERPEPLTVTIRPAAGDDGRVVAAASATAAPGSVAGGASQGNAPAPRRVTLGTVPDFAFAGPGVRVESVVPESSAARAGVVAGDVITAIDGRAVPTLQAYSDLLKTLDAGATVALTLQRGGREQTLRAQLQAR